MIIHFKKTIGKNAYDEVIDYLNQKGIKFTAISSGSEKMILTDSDDSDIELDGIYSFDAIKDINKITTPYKLVSKCYINDKDLVLPYNNRFSSNNFIVIAGPCSVESEESLKKIAAAVKAAGATILRGGTYKLRTSPYSFQGLEEKGLKILAKVGKEFGLLTVSEITAISQIPLFLKYVDIIQVGARNMYNYELLKELSKVDKPILLKRSFSATIEELLLSAEYLAENGNNNIILCERGIRTFEKEMRNTLDLGAVVRLKELTYLKVIVDPSHASGRYEMVPKLSMAALAVGADGIMVEVHDDPANASSDGKESLKLEKFSIMMSELKNASKVFKRKI